MTARFTSVATALGGRPGPAGKPGPAGGGGTTLFSLRASSNLSGHRVVRPDGQDSCLYASNRRLADAQGALGVTTGAALAGTLATVQTGGYMTEPSWNWIPDSPVFLGADGQLQQYAPDPAIDPQATFLLIVGVAVSANTLNIDFKTPIAL